MDRTELLKLWNDMWNEGNWVPSWPDSLMGLGAADAAWRPDANSHSIWQEVVHVTFWRRVTIDRMAGAAPPSDETIEQFQFAVPEAGAVVEWDAAVAALKETQDVLAAAIQDESKDISRIAYHLIHDAYHLGRITQLRAMQGTQPKF